MTYTKANVLKPGDNKGAGGNKKDTIILVDMNDIQIFPDRDANGVVITNNLVLNIGAYMIKLYTTVTTVVGGDSSEGDPDAEGFVHNLVFDHPGSSIAIREFKANWIFRNMVALVQKCGDTSYDIYGTPCAPMRMVVKWDDTKDKNTHVFTLKSLKCQLPVGSYQGSVTFDTGMGTIAANTTALGVAAGPGTYQLTDGTPTAATITTLSGAIDKGIYTFLGSGGLHPSIITFANDFVLLGGVSWNALSGSMITFKAINTGGSTWKFVEQSRV
jgi:hypothetical protein